MDDMTLGEAECTCDLIDVSTNTEILFVRGRSRGCVVHPPTEYEVRLVDASALVCDTDETHTIPASEWLTLGRKLRRAA